MYFYCILYAKYWFTAPSSKKAPQNDLIFLKSILAFDSINTTISKYAASKFLWYLSEELVTLALFDETLPLSVKKSMAESVLKSAKNKDKRLKKAETTSKDLENIKDMDLPFFVTANSLNFVKILNIPHTFFKRKSE